MTAKPAISYKIISSIVYSKNLKREVRVDFYFPSHYTKNCRVLFLNDGQDASTLHLKFTLERLLNEKRIYPLIVIAIHANEDRLQEYGIASKADYLKRGNRAKKHTKFIIKELKPYAEDFLKIEMHPQHCCIAGFSLGGLSAFDIAWNNATVFSKVGVFSGSFWWRKKDYKKGYTDNDRIMHEVIRKTKKKPDLKFWIQTGTEDEKADRNSNGIIDSIEDSLDIIHELALKGFKENEVTYVEVKGGKHNQQTWAEVMPDFLQWAFGKKKFEHMF